MKIEKYISLENNQSNSMKRRNHMICYRESLNHLRNTDLSPISFKAIQPSSSRFTEPSQLTPAANFPRISWLEIFIHLLGNSIA